MTIVTNVWKHRCVDPDNCKYLGVFDKGNQKVDLYRCGKSYIGRFGADNSQYVRMDIGNNFRLTEYPESCAEYIDCFGEYQFMSWMADAMRLAIERDKSGKTFPKVCEFCKSEIKERELFFSKTFSCMC